MNQHGQPAAMLRWACDSVLGSLDFIYKTFKFIEKLQVTIRSPDRHEQ
jgi:hypothetical protein